MAITDWPADERPRERLLSRGAQVLSDAELLALFLRVGIKGKSAVDLARDLLGHFGGLSALCRASQPDFSAFPGMGPAKYAQLQAVMELARRAIGEQLAQRDVFDSPGAVRDWLRLHLAALGHEVFVVIFLDAQNRVICYEEMFRGTLTQTLTPEPLMGRVLAVNSLFIGSSNELGAFESGLAAKCFGLANSVALGGLMTLLTVGAVAARAPKLRALKRIVGDAPPSVG